MLDPQNLLTQLTGVASDIYDISTFIKMVNLFNPDYRFTLSNGKRIDNAREHCLDLWKSLTELYDEAVRIGWKDDADRILNTYDLRRELSQYQKRSLQEIDSARI